MDWDVNVAFGVCAKLFLLALQLAFLQSGRFCAVCRGSVL